MPADIKTHYRACNLCEAICGLEIKTQGDQVLSIKGDKNDHLSRGYICPEGTAMMCFQCRRDGGSGGFSNTFFFFNAVLASTKEEEEEEEKKEEYPNRKQKQRLRDATL